MLDDDLKKAEEIMFSLFPNVKKYPMNSLTPSLSETEDYQISISFLLLADDEIINDFKLNTSGRTPIAVSSYYEDSPNGHGLDFVLKFDFYFPNIETTFETVLYADDKIAQKNFLNGLKSVNNFLFWIVSSEYKLIKCISLNFDFSKAKIDIDTLLNANKIIEN